jgi:hypothetical protein
MQLTNYYYYFKSVISVENCQKIIDIGNNKILENEKKEFDEKLKLNAQKIKDEEKAIIESEKKKADALYAAILPLLSRLKQKPERDYIYWPNRLPKVQEFEKSLASIMK